MIVLDDFMEFIDNKAARPLFTDSCDALSVFQFLQGMVNKLLKTPGMFFIVTGRSTELTTSILQTDFVSPVFAAHVMLDALSLKDIINILWKSPGQDLRAELGLYNETDVQLLATCLRYYSGGCAGAVKCAIDGLIKNGALRSRGPDTSIDAVLTDALMMEDIYQTAIQSRDLLPTISRASPSWDQTTTMLSLLSVLQRARDNQTIPATERVAVSSCEVTTVVDLLSVIGMPFTKSSTRGSSSELTVQLSPWICKSLAASATNMTDVFFDTVYPG